MQVIRLRARHAAIGKIVAERKIRQELGSWGADGIDGLFSVGCKWLSKSEAVWSPSEWPSVRGTALGKPDFLEHLTPRHAGCASALLSV